MEGWIKLNRSFLEHWLCDEYRPLTKQEAWIKMLFLVNYEFKKTLIHGQLIECNRGQSVLSIESWAEKFTWSIGQVRHFFKLLENDKMIKLEGLKYTTRLTICNYDKYQDIQQTDDKLTTNSRLSDDKLTTTTKGSKEGKEVKNILMRNSLVFNLEYLKTNIGDDYQKYDLEYYHKSLLNWSDSKAKKMVDWVAVIRNAILRDEKENKAKLQQPTQTKLLLAR